MNKAFLTSFCCFTLIVGSLSAATLTVTNTADSGVGSLRAAITASVSGDVIAFAPGAAGTITLATPLPVIAKDLTIDAGAIPVTISGGGVTNTRPFTITSGKVDISNLTIIATNATGGVGGDGGGGSPNPAGGGGGGLGAGGAVLVGNPADVTLTNIVFGNGLIAGTISATGGAGGDAGAGAPGVSGAGGGGGLGGAGSSAPTVAGDGFGGGGIIGSAVDTSGVDGGGDGAKVGPIAALPGAFGGGGGGGNEGAGSGATSAFGGGGGGGGEQSVATPADGGAGGFGGGGGGGGSGAASSVLGGQGSLAGDGGSGSATGGGGGGAGSGFGGVIFTETGGKLTLNHCSIDDLPTTIAGAAGVGAGGGAAGVAGSTAGNAMYLMSGVNAILASDTLGSTAIIRESVSGPGGITKTGTGDYTLTGTNDYIGGTTVLTGTLIGNTDSLQGIISNSAALTFDMPGPGTFVGTISGMGALEKTGVAALTFDSQQLLTGPTKVDQGTLTLSHLDALSASSSIGLVTGTTLSVTTTTSVNNLSGDGDVTIAGGADLTVNIGSALTLEGAISGMGSLTKGGAGDYTLLGTNTYTGPTTITEGNLIGNAASLTGAFVIGTGVNSAQLTCTHPIDGTDDITTSGSGLFVKEGPGILTLTGVLAHTGGSHIVDGGLILNEDSMRGAFTLKEASTSLVYDSGAAHTYTGNGATGIGGLGSFTKKGGSNLTLAVLSAFSGPTVVEGGTLTLDSLNALSSSSSVTINTGTTLAITDSAIVNNLSGDGDVTIDLGFDLTVNVLSPLTLEGVISGMGSLTKSGSGDYTLEGANTYTGGTTITEGNLIGNTASLTGAFAIGTGVNPAQLTYIQTIAGTDGITTTGSGKFIKDGSGILTLTGTLAHTGGTLVKNGGLILNDSSMMGAFTLETISTSLVFDSPLPHTYTGNGTTGIGGLGPFKKKGVSNLTLDVASTFTGSTMVEGGTLTLDDLDALSSSSSVTIGTGTTLAVTDTTIVNNLSGDGDVTIALGEDLTVNVLSPLTLEGIISGMGSLTKGGAGDYTLAGTNTYTGGTTITEGNLIGTTASLTGAFAIGTGGNPAELTYIQPIVGTDDITTTGSGIFNKEGGGILSLTGTLAHTGGTLVNNGGLILNDSSMMGAFTLETVSTSLVFDSPLPHTYTGNGATGIGGLGSFKKRGVSNLTLDVASTFTGSTMVEGGTLTLDDLDALSSSSSVGINTGTTLGIATTTSVNDLSGDGDVTLAGGADLTVNVGTDLTLEGAISGLGSFTKSGAGEYTLLGANTYTGGTTITEGNLIGNAASLTGAFAIGTGVNPAQLIFDQPVVKSAAITTTGPGYLIKNGAGILTLTGALAHTGGTVVNEGSLILNESSMNGAFTLFSATTGLTYDSAIAHTYTGDGTTGISGLGPFKKRGAGNLTLDVASSFTGLTVVEEGTLTLDDLDALSSSISVNVNTGATLGVATTTSVNDLSGDGNLTLAGGSTLTANNAADLTLEGAISGAGAFFKNGAGDLTLLGTNSYTGGTTINEGILIGNADSLTGAIAIGIGANPAQLIFNQLVDESDSITTTGPGLLIKDGGGILTLTGALAHLGGTFVKNGSLVVNESSMAGAFTLETVDTGLIYDSGAPHTYIGDPLTGFGIGGLGFFTKRGVGSTLTLDVANTFTGPTVVEEGSLALMNADAISSSRSVDVKLGAALFPLVTMTLNELQGDGAIVISAGADLTAENATDTTISGDISGAGKLIKSGPGTLTLTGTNTYTGDTDLNQGQLIGNSDSLTGLININTGTVAPGLIFNQTFTGTDPLTTAGDGILEKTGAGQLTLTGVLAHTGGTIVSDGILVVNQDSMSGDFSLTSNTAGLTYDDPASLTYFDIISGTGFAFTKKGTGTLRLRGANTFTAPTEVEEGILDIRAGGTIAESSSVNINTPGTLNIRVDTVIKNLSGDGFIGLGNNDELTVENNVSSIFAGDISDIPGASNGQLIKSGIADLFLTGTNTYTGLTTVDEGRLLVTSSSLPAAGGALVSASTDLIFRQDFDGTYAGDISGAGKVTKELTGILTLSGVNTYTGGTLISGGAVQASVANLPLSGGIQNDGTMIFNQPIGATYSQVIGGTGGLQKLGFGNLILSAANTFLGPTTVFSGRLTIGNADALSSSSSLDLQTASTLDVDVAATVNELKGDGSVILNANLTVNNENDSTLEGVISGSGRLIKNGAGSFEILGENTYTGSTTINEGKVIGNATSLTGLFFIGTGVNPAQLVFDQNFDATDTITTAGPGVLTKTGSGALTLLSSLLHTGGTNIEEGILILDEDSMSGDITMSAATAGLTYDSPFDLTYSGQISGIGIFTKRGAGTLNLTSASSFSGSTEVEDGTLRLSDADAISSSSSVNVNVPGTLRISVSALIQELSGDGFVTLDGSTDLTVENNMPSLYEGIISGDGNLIKTGISDLFITGMNTYTGGTTVDEGSLSVTSLSLPVPAVLPVLVNPTSELIFNQDFNGSYGGLITGGGQVVKNGSGILTLTGTNTYTGGTIVTEGTLVGNTTSLQGDILNNASLVFDQAVAGTYSDIISGAGVFEKKGLGTLTLSNANTYTGKTTITKGTLELTNADSISSSTLVDIEPVGTLLVSTDTTIQNLEGSGTVSIPSVLDTLTIKQDTTTLYPGIITGDGAVVKTGTGNLNLTGPNTYSAGTTITEGTLTGNSDSLQGVIVNNAQLVINQTFTGDDTEIVSISGTGDVTKAGPAVFTLNGNWSYTGKTFVNNGILDVQGTILTTSETIVASGALLRGIGTVANLTNFGTVKAGNSIGTINVIGTYTQAPGSILQVEIDDAGNASLVNVTGNAVIDVGATIQVHPEPGLYAIGQQYVVIDTTAGRTGTFSNLIIFNEDELDGATLQDIYTPTQVLLQVAPVGITPEKAAPAFFNATLAVQSAWLADSILSGQLDWATQTTCCGDVEPCCYTPFVTSQYVTGCVDETSTTIKGQYSVWGVYAGADTYLSDSSLIGITGGYVEGHIHSGESDSDSHNTALSLAIYGRKDWCDCQWVLDGYVAGIWSEFKSKRHDVRKIHGTTFGGNVIGKVRFSYELDCNWVYFRPQIGLIGDYTVIDGFSETSSSSRRITFDRGRIGFLDGEVALSIGFPIECDCGVIFPEVKGGYLYEFINDSMNVDAVMPVFPFTATSFKIDPVNRDHFFARAGISFGICRDTKIGAYYEGIYDGDKWDDHSWRISFNSGF